MTSQYWNTSTFLGYTLYTLIVAEKVPVIDVDGSWWIDLAS